MKIRAKMTALLMALGLVANVNAAQPNQVETLNGTLQGVSQNGITSFLGVPYAKPPVGELRWKAPVPADKWQGVKVADKFAAQCPQNDDLGVFASKGGAEDCLYLNVYVNEKARASGEKLPVLVWIYGGALVVGASNDYDPVELVKQGKGIVVTLNYRLGALGFLATPSLNEGQARHTNYGFMDQALALDWVKNNIAQFGGDVENITIAGESSGAHSVLAQVVSPYSAGKFQHAIAMSGGNMMNKYPNIAAPLPLEVALQKGAEFEKAVNCDNADCLRQLPVETILKAQTPFMPRTAIIDGDFLPMPFADAFKQGKFNKVTLVNGNTLNEGNFFTGTIEQMSGKMISDEAYPQMIKELYGNLADDVLKQYAPEKYLNAGEAFAAAFTDSVFACPAAKMDEVLSSQIPVYAYEFADETAPSYLSTASVATKAAHTYEIPYLFKGFNGSSGKDTSLNAFQKPLSSQMIGIWTNVKNLNQIEPEWKSYNAQQQNLLSFRLPTSEIEQGKFAERHQCGFWEKAGLY